jgi:hypothetical protein
VTDGPPKPKTPTRFIATGCTVVIAIAVAIAAFAGFAFYKISKGMDEIAALGPAWLSKQPQAEAEFGEIQNMERIPKRFSVQIRNDEGDGWFEYRVTGARASGEARIAMTRRQGEWRAVGARLTVGGRDVPIGTPP